MNIYLFWLLSSLICSAHLIYVTCFDEDFNWDDALAEKGLATLVVIVAAFTPAIYMFAVIFCLTFEKYKAFKIRKIRTIIRRWENIEKGYRAIKSNKDGVVGYVENVNIMRENMHHLSIKELKFLISIDEKDFNIEKTIKDALLDELFEREILKDKKDN